MTIKNFVIKNYPTAKYSKGLNSIKNILIQHEYVVVVDEKNNYLGVITPLDLIIRPNKILADCLTEKEFLDTNMTINYVFQKFKESNVSAFPIKDNGVFFGVLTRKKFFENQWENFYLKQTEYFVKSIKHINNKKDFAVFKYCNSVRKQFMLSENWYDVTGILPNDMKTEPLLKWLCRLHKSCITSINSDIKDFIKGNLNRMEHTVELWHPEKKWRMLYVAAVANRNPKEDKISTVNAIIKDISGIQNHISYANNNLKLEQLLDKTNALLYFKNAEGKYQYVNEAFAKQFSTNKHNLFGKSVENILLNGLARDIIKHDKQVILKRKSMTFEELLSDKNKHAIFITNKTPVFDKNNKLEGIFCVSNDISNLKITEEKLSKTNELLKKANNQLRQEISFRERLENENTYLKEALELTSAFDDIICIDDKFKRVLNEIKKVAKSDTTVLITGETGTGKELVAKAIYRLSDRNNAPFVKINCSAIPEGLLESELFGHEKGSFSGATQTKIGKFEFADGGTIFLDEIGELPTSLQPKLLRILQENEYERIGSNITRRCNVRIISATNKNLNEEVEKNRFRIDLFYRLNVFPIHIPPLRERKKDIPGLVDFFIKKYNKKTNKHINFISNYALNKLIEYDWPGNVRELENIIERAIILSSKNKLIIENFIPKNEEIKKKEKYLSLEDVERKHILEILETTSWKIGGNDGAAKILGLNRTTLHYRMKKLGISYQKTSKEN